MAPRTKASAGTKGAKGTPSKAAAAVVATTPSQKPGTKEKVRYAIALFSLTGPINVTIFFPGFMVLSELWKEGGEILRPCFALQLLPLEKLPGTLAELLAQPEAAALAAALLCVAIACLFGGIRLVRTAMGLFRAAGGTIAEKDPPKTLVVSGPYAYVRNPIALGQLMILTAEGLLVGIPRVLALAGVYAIFLLIHTPCSEEPSLRARFGPKWVHYEWAVGAWIPRCSPWQPALEQL